MTKTVRALACNATRAIISLLLYFSLTLPPPAITISPTTRVTSVADMKKMRKKAEVVIICAQPILRTNTFGPIFRRMLAEFS